jgi:8-oxo-dGTP diphosphatase
MNKKLKTKNINDPSVYFRPSVAADGIVFNVIEGELHVLLVKRKYSETSTKEIRPYQGFWALPGGFIRAKESAEEAIVREISEETGLKINTNKVKLHQVGFYSIPDRDAWSFDGKKQGLYRQTMSCAFGVILQKKHMPKASTDAEDAKYFKVSDILSKNIEKKVLAFDHNNILLDTINLFVKKLALEPIALDFCDDRFTIGDVRMVYQSFWSLVHDIEHIEIGNFQNKLMKQIDEYGNPIIIPLPDKPENRRSQEGRGAPALLCERNKKASLFSHVMVPKRGNK